MLTKLGHRVDIVGDGLEAIQALNLAHYDAVLMDVQMPQLDGLRATRRIRTEMPPDRQPYIIALTASASQEDRTDCLGAGMDAYLAKPMRLAEVVAALDAAGDRTAASGRADPNRSSRRLGAADS